MINKTTLTYSVIFNNIIFNKSEYNGMDKEVLLTRIFNVTGKVADAIYYDDYNEGDIYDVIGEVADNINPLYYADILNEIPDAVEYITLVIAEGFNPSTMDWSDLFKQAIYLKDYEDGLNDELLIKVLIFIKNSGIESYSLDELDKIGDDIVNMDNIEDIIEYAKRGC